MSSIREHLGKLLVETHEIIKHINNLKAEKIKLDKHVDQPDEWTAITELQNMTQNLELQVHKLRQTFEQTKDVKAENDS